MRRHLHRMRFRAMGTWCTLAVTGAELELGSARQALRAGRAEVAACEGELSRFDPASDLSRLNGAAGSWVAVGPRLLGALAAAVRSRVETEGRFDPTILPALVAAGYDRSFEQVVPHDAEPVPGWWSSGGSIDVDEANGLARISAGTAVDLGGIGKGFSAMRAVAAMRAAWPGLPGALADLGGDVQVWGRSPSGGPWLLRVADPRDAGGTLGTLRLEKGGVATSGREERRFGRDQRLHHLIDPATGRCAVGGPIAVTVVAPDAIQAEAHATALAIGPMASSSAYVAARPEIAALLVDGASPIRLGQPPLADPVRLRVRL